MKLSEQIARRQLFVAFGTSQQTGSLSSVDLAATRDGTRVMLSAADGSVAPIAGADAATAGVMTAADKARLDALPPTTTQEFGALAEVPGTAVSDAITHLRTAGSGATGDGGGGLYRRAAAEPGHAFKTQSAEGAWWEGAGPFGPTQLGAADGADPTGREAQAPALVTALSAYRRDGVTLRQLLGESYSAAKDASVALNGFLDDLAPAGIAVTDPDGTELLCEASLFVRDGLKLLLSPHTTIRKGGTFDGLLTNPAWGMDVGGFLIEGGHWTTVDSAQTGALVKVYGDDWIMRRMRVTEFHNGGNGGQAFVFGGDNIAISDVFARTSSSAAGTGVFRCIGGTGGRFQNLYGEGGDDIFQLVPVTDSADARFDRSIADMRYVNCHGHSKAARLMIAAISGPQNAGANAGTVRHVGFLGVSGKGVNRAVYVGNDECDGSTGHAVGWVHFIGCSIDCASLDQTTAQAIHLEGSATGGELGPIVLDKVTVRDNPRKHALTATLCSRVALRDCDMSGEESALQITSVSERLAIEGGRYHVANNGGGNGANHAVVLTGSARSDLDGVKIEGVASNKAGLRLNSGAAFTTLRNVGVDKASGATGTIAVSHAAGATVRLETRVGGAHDAEQAGSGTVRHADVRELTMAVVPHGTPLAVAPGDRGITVPASLAGWSVVDVRATVHTKGVTGATRVNLIRRRGGMAVNVLSTSIALGDDWTQANGAIDAANDDLAAGDQLIADVTQVHGGTPPEGLELAVTVRPAG